MPQKLYILNDQDNPVRKARRTMSRRNFAAAANVGTNVIARCELGLFNTLPPAVLRLMSELHGETEEDFFFAWQAWQYERRIEIGEAIRLGWPPNERIFKSHFVESFFRQVAADINGSSSDYSVARVFSLHPVTWAQYLERGGGAAHDSVLTVCIEDIMYEVNNE